jgi:hypothetical protein
MFGAKEQVLHGVLATNKRPTAQRNSPVAANLARVSMSVAGIVWPLTLSAIAEVRYDKH